MKIQYPIRKLVSFSVISTICLLISFSGVSQCALGTFYDSGVAPMPGLISNISPCNYAGEYNTVTDVIAGDVYSVTVSGTYITVYDNSSVAVAYGTSPVSFTATSSGVYSTQINTDAACGTDASCHQCQWENISPGPSNDSCANATTINCGDVIVGETIYATDDAPFIAGQSLQGCGPGIAANTPGVWYYFLGTGDDVVASTCNAADFDTRITIYSGSCGSLACVAGNDDGPTCSGYTSEASFQTTVGVDYYIFVHGYGNSLAEQGNFTLSLSCSAACAPLPGNDACGSAQSLNVYVAGSCAPTAGSNLCAADATANPTCDPWGIIQDVWYTFNTGANASVSIDLQAITANPNGLKMALYSSCGGTEIDCFSGGAGLQSIGGLSSATDYYLQVWSSSIDEGDFTVCVSESSCDVLVNVSVSPATSAGGSDGSASAIVSGNQGNLSYLWSTGATTAAISGLVSATYAVTVTDDVSSGCTAISSGYVTDPSVTVSCSITASIAGNNPTLYGASDGSVTAIPNGNQGNITYNWSSGSLAQALTGLAGGVFSVTITDDITTGCSATASVTLTEPAPTCNLFLTAVGYDVSINGGSDGSAQAFVSGGQSIVSYIWSSGSTTDISTGLSAGVEFVTVVDNIIPTCSVTDAITITQPICAVSASVSGINATIYGGSDGSATASAIGGQGIVSYLWSNASTTAAITGLIANTYSVTITDDIAPSCQAIAEITITEPLPTCNLSVTVVGYDVSTNGGSDGSAQVVASGGQSIVSYTWTSGSTTVASTGLMAGIETVTVVDNIISTCSVTESVTITQPECLVSVAISGNNATTIGGSDGSASASLSGGQGIINYLWSNAATTTAISGLMANVYSVTVTDDFISGCEAVSTVTITEPGICALSATVTESHVTINGGSDGSASVTAIGGQGIISYLWSNGSTTATISGLSAIIYSVTITDDIAFSCEAIGTVTVTEPPAGCFIAATAAGANVTNNGGSDGSAAASISGELGNITYAWSNGETTSAIVNITAGIYTVTVTDDTVAGCSVSATVTITEPALTCDILANLSVTAAATAGGSDGAAEAMVTGAQGNLTYMWSNGGTTSMITGLPTNTYLVTVTDDVIAGCTTSASGLVTDPSVTVSCNLSVTASSIDPTSYGASDGSATAIPAGNQGNLSYLWDNGATTQLINGLAGGIFTVTVTDDIIAGCAAIASVTLTEPAPTCNISVTVSGNDATTYGGSDGDAAATVTGGQGTVTYMWSNGGTTSMISGLTAGTYDVTVMDDVLVGCADTLSVQIIEPAPTCNISVTASGNDASTIGGSDGDAIATVTGGQGNVTYLWDNSSTTALITGLSAGTYSVTVKDNVLAGCEAAATVTISEPAIVTCTLAASLSATDATLNGASDGTATVIVTGSQGNVTYAWSNAETTGSISGLVAGSYTVTVTDDATADCNVVDTVTIGEPLSVAALTNSIQIQLFPNPNNGNFVVSISEAGNYNVVIRNVIGQSIYRNLINGTITEVKLNNVESGIYFVAIQSDGFERTEKIIIK